MTKTIKFILGLVVVLCIGFFYGKFERAVKESSEPKMYGVISFEYPNEMTKLISIKESPASQCEKWRSDYFEAMNKKCKGCKLLINSCVSEQPKEYIGVFEQKKIAVPYVYKPYLYPEVSILEGLPEGTFSKICEVEKSSFDKAICIE